MGQRNMEMCVDEPCSRVRRRLAVAGVGIAGIEQQEITRTDPGKMPAVRVEQELRAVIRHRRAEMIGDSFVETEACGPAERGREIASRLGFEILHRSQPNAFSGHVSLPIPELRRHPSIIETGQHLSK